MLLPGIPEVFGNVLEPQPYETDADTPTFTGDLEKVQTKVSRTNVAVIHVRRLTSGRKSSTFSFNILHSSDVKHFLAVIQFVWHHFKMFLKLKVLESL